MLKVGPSRLVATEDTTASTGENDANTADISKRVLHGNHFAKLSDRPTNTFAVVAREQ